MELCSDIKWEELLLYGVTGSFESEEELFYVYEEALKGGMKIVQYREKKASFDVTLRRARRLRSIAKHYGALLIINDFIEIAKEVNADGVHLGQGDESVSKAREVLGKSKIIGKSTHSLEQAVEAQKSEIDYMAIGPVFSTPTKPGTQAVGLEMVKKVKNIAKIPLVAIGGIDEKNITRVIGTGVDIVAVVRAVFSSKNPKESVISLRAKFRF